MEMQQTGNLRYVMVDLLVDLLVYPDGQYHLVDLDEFADSMEKGEITKRQQIHTIRTLDQMIASQTQDSLIPDFVAEAKMYDL